MNTVFFRLLAIASLALSLPVHAAECTFPKAPETIPDGKTASEAEMMAAMAAFKSYNEAVTAFSECLAGDTQSKSAGTAQLMQLKTMQAKKHNAAVAELQAKAKQFNEQVRIFKSRG